MRLFSEDADVKAATVRYVVLTIKSRTALHKHRMHKCTELLEHAKQMQQDEGQLARWNQQLTSLKASFTFAWKLLGLQLESHETVFDMLIEAHAYRLGIEKLQRRDANSKKGVLLNRMGERGHFNEAGLNRLCEMRDTMGQIKHLGRSRAVHGVHDATLVEDVASMAKHQSCADSTSRLHDMQRLWCWRRQFETEVYVNPTIAISDEATKKGQSAVVTNLRGTAACGSMAEECLGLRFLDSNVLQHGEGK